MEIRKMWWFPLIHYDNAVSLLYLGNCVRDKHILSHHCVLWVFAQED